MIGPFKALALVFSTALATQTAAQESRPVRLVVPFPSGNVVDSVARLIAEPMSKVLGQPVFVENRPGAGGTIGTGFVAKAPADGQTVMVTGISTVVDAYINTGRTPLNPTTDLTPVGIASSGSFLLVTSPATGITSIDELVRKARTVPNSLTYASVGEGTVNHLLVARFAKLAGFSALHVPYKDTWFPDLLSGRVTFMLGSTGSSAPHVQSGKLTALANLAPNRSAALPEVPTVRELGYPYLTHKSSLHLYLPGQAPRELVQRYNSALNTALREPAVRQRYADLGIDVIECSPEEAAADVQALVEEFAQMRKVAFEK